VIVEDRDRIQVARVGAALLWAVGRANGAAFEFTPRRVDERLGSAALREALLAGEDPDRMIDRLLAAVIAYEKDVRRFQLYR
jgi:hypothetical protein